MILFSLMSDKTAEDLIDEGGRRMTNTAMERLTVAPESPGALEITLKNILVRHFGLERGENTDKEENALAELIWAFEASRSKEQFGVVIQDQYTMWLVRL